MVLWSSEIVINTAPSKSTPWTIKVYDLYVCNGLLNNCIDLENPDELRQLRELIAKLPAVINIPRLFTELSTPRYYLVVAELNTKNEVRITKIIDVIGIRADLSPTKWSYRVGYWHPICQHEIISTIDRYLKRLETTQATQQATQPAIV